MTCVEEIHVTPLCTLLQASTTDRISCIYLCMYVRNVENLKTTKFKTYVLEAN